MSEEGSTPSLVRTASNVEFSDSGTGPTVVLIQFGERQPLVAKPHGCPRTELRVCAINVRGDGETTPYPGTRAQTLDDQVAE